MYACNPSTVPFFNCRLICNNNLHTYAMYAMKHIYTVHLYYVRMYTVFLRVLYVISTNIVTLICRYAHNKSGSTDVHVCMYTYALMEHSNTIYVPVLRLVTSLTLVLIHV